MATGFDVVLAQVLAALDGNGSARATVYRSGLDWDWAMIEHRVLRKRHDAGPALRALRNGTDPAAAEPDVDAFALLRDLIDRPELLEPPECVIPRLAWRARTTLHAAPDKSGKSTLWRHAVTAKSHGRHWLGEPTDQGRAVWCGLEEALGDTVRQLHELGADPGRVRILTLRPPDLLARLRSQLDEWPTDVLVVDSLAEYARVTRGTAPDDGDSAGWGSVMRPLVALSRDHDCAVGLLHHPRRSDGQYRGAGEIAAAVDVLWEMHRPQQGEDPTLRRFRGRARWPLDDWAARLEDGRYVMGAGGPISLDAQIVADTGQHPGTSRTAQHERLGGRKQTYLRAVSRLLEVGTLREHNTRLYMPSDIPEDLL